MDQNNNAPRHVPTPEEIARAEAEAVQALQRGEPLPARPETPAQAGEDESRPRPDFVPYVDDVESEPQPAEAVEPEEEEDEAPYEPSDMEKRIAAIPEGKWNLYQILVGAALGVLVILILVLGTEDLGSWALILAALLAMIVPRYVERWGGRKMPRARIAMLIAMFVTLAASVLITGLRNGFNFFEK